MKYRIFYSNTKTRSKRTLDGEIVRKESDYTVYHTDLQEIDAVKVFHSSDKESIILYENGDIIDTTVLHIREKEYEYEQYILGYGYYATSSNIGFYGEIDKYKENKAFSDNIRINRNTIIEGNAEYDNKWEWNIKEVGDNVSISINEGKLPEELDTEKCVIIGSDEPINSVCIFDPIK